MAIDKKELSTRLWTEWTNGLKILANSLAKDQVEIINSACTTVLGNENFIQKAVMYVQRKTYIGKFKDYKSRISAYEKSIIELIGEVNRAAPVETSEWPSCRLVVKRPLWKIGYRSTLGEIIIDGDDSFENADWGDHAIDVYEKLSAYVSHMMDVLSQAQDKLEQQGGTKMNAEEEINKRAESMSREDVGDAIGKEKKAERLAKGNGFLRQYWQDIKISFALLKDWYMGNYRKIPFRMVASIAAAMLYLVSPLDVVPDWVPFGGLLDDALVLAAIFALSRSDLDAYTTWTGRQK